ncbi:hypothetical protein GGR54DRAFT_640264 [Hypoxylon sp. NC1633]|nr:hypothetical protein GGR54DRAFT_640264 [Hypoxylon sp. NC1633]
MTTAITNNTIGQADESTPKHRACDECRTRKLACTKEADGCSRCKREGIVCHYSPQKPMGRPKKRPRDEFGSGDANVNPANKNIMTNIPPNTEDPGLAFINLLTAETNFDVLGTGTENGSGSGSGNGGGAQQEKGYSWFGYTGDSLGDIPFDPAPQTAPSFGPMSNIDPSLFISVEPPPSQDQVPDLSPNTNTASTPDSVASSTAAAAAAGCAHTAQLYLALDSMQRTPAGTEDALRHARAATKTAYDVVYCPICSFQIEPRLPPFSPGECRAHSADTMRNFQNLMLLAALIPSIAHAYERILAAVDEEARRATAERRRLVFKLRGFGGMLWGDHPDGDCGGGVASLDHREMEPAMWRLTVRALLKADVYGLSGLEADAAAASLPLHLGLKDIVLMMEQKSRARHAVMDAMIRAGALQEPEGCGLRMHVQGETPTCEKVIAIAKASIDALIIA